VHINVSHGPQLHSESQIRISQAMHMLSLASTALDRLEVFCFISALLYHIILSDFVHIIIAVQLALLGYLLYV